MVNVRAQVPQGEDGSLDLPQWVERLCEQRSHLNARHLLQITEWLHARDEAVLIDGLELAELVAELKMDHASVLAALVYRGVRRERLQWSDLVANLGAEATDLVYAVATMATSSLLEMSDSPFLTAERRDQVENIKRMLVAMIDDARVAVVKLAERVIVLRHAKHHDDARRHRIAMEASQIFAPLAGRLGIWQLKWELEDLALRYTQGDVYMQIAKQLQGKRGEREAQVDLMVDQVRALLRGHGIEAAVFGRAKHIYSIWRKMQSKGVGFDQVYDVRAVRVVVDSLAQCYAALGIIHTTWSHLPSEFDDYIASPKENGYRSIHTAVTAADGGVLEIQIRTMDMHEDAELGVCAHWSYKDGRREIQDFDEKMLWLRQVVEWHDDMGGTENISTLLRHRVHQERIYVSTPKGHVLDLPVGATLLDFAYRVHTDVGHSCIGGIIDGRTGKLTQELQTGQQVEVLTEVDRGPQRLWLERELGVIRTDRARAKLVSYFRGLADEQKVAIAQRVMDQQLCLLGLPRLDAAGWVSLAEGLGRADVDELQRSLGTGEVSLFAAVVTIAQAASRLTLPGRLALTATGDNRDGLLRDLTQLVSEQQFSMTSSQGRVSNTGEQAIIGFQVVAQDWLGVLRLLNSLSLVPGVLQVVLDATAAINH